MKLSGTATRLILNYGLASATRGGEHIDETATALKEYVTALELAVDPSRSTPNEVDPAVSEVSRLRSLVERMEAEPRINGIVFLIQREGSVLMERCPKKRTVLGVGEWFIPGGKLDGEETAEQALIREVGEELGVTVLGSDPLPIVEGSPVPALPALESYYGTPFLMRPFVITVAGVIPQRTIDGDIELRWVPISEALESPVPQVRMMVAALRRLSSGDSEQ